MNNWIFALNTLIIVGVVLSGVLAVALKRLLSSIIALSITGSLVALEFLMLAAPDVAIAEAAVGAVLTAVIFIVAMFKVEGGCK